MVRMPSNRGLSLIECAIPFLVATGPAMRMIGPTAGLQCGAARDLGSGLTCSLTSANRQLQSRALRWARTKPDILFSSELAEAGERPSYETSAINRPMTQGG